MTKKPTFLVIEGIDGAGKTTLVQKLRERAIENGREDKIVFMSAFDKSFPKIDKVYEHLKSYKITLTQEDKAMMTPSQFEQRKKEHSDFMELVKEAYEHALTIITKAIEENKHVVIDRWLMSVHAYNYDDTIGFDTWDVEKFVKDNPQFSLEIAKIATVHMLRLSTSVWVCKERLKGDDTKDSVYDKAPVGYLRQLDGRYEEAVKFYKLLAKTEKADIYAEQDNYSEYLLDRLYKMLA